MSSEVRKCPLDALFNKHYNHQESREKGLSIDKDGNPIPWMTYAAIFYLEQLDMSTKDVFEWGSGNSSLFFSQRVRSIVSIEYKKDWYEYVLAKKTDNMTLILADETEYASVINKDSKKYDVIVVDGEIDRRLECAQYAVSHLRDTGVVIVDNSDWLTNTCAFLRDQDFIQVDMAGLGPINNYTWCTSFFFRRGFDFKPLNLKAPEFVPGGIQNVRD